jgi:hypothetical protein
MKPFFSRYGGHTVIIGQGKVGHLNLPEDQSLDNMLDHHAMNPVPNVFYLTSYIQQPEFMGAYSILPKGTFYLGELEHEFMEVMLQYDLRTWTRIYIGRHQYTNVYSVFLKTDPDSYSSVLALSKEERKPTYDYVLTFFFRGLRTEYEDIRRSPEQLEMILILLCYHMGLGMTEAIFTPSNTWIGKLIRPEFQNELYAFIQSDPGEEDIKTKMAEYVERMRNKMEG